MQGLWEEVAGRLDSLQFTLAQLLPTLSFAHSASLQSKTYTRLSEIDQGALAVAVNILSAGWYIILCLCTKSLSLSS